MGVLGKLAQIAISAVKKDAIIFLSKISAKLTLFKTKILAGLMLFPSFVSHLPFEIHVTNLVKSLTRLIITNNDQTRQISKQTLDAMIDALSVALQKDYYYIKLVFLISISVLILAVLIPLFYKALLNPKTKVFISFNRARENIANELESSFSRDGARAYRIPYQEGANHQDIVTDASKGIKTCNCFVCVPGNNQSFVEHEVMAAYSLEKPIVFVLSEVSGTIPNTADKRYPMFKLESCFHEQFKSLIEFVSYVGADFKSTWKLLKKALKHPFIVTTATVSLAFIVIATLSLWSYCLFKVFINILELTQQFPVLAQIKADVIFAYTAIFGGTATIAFICFAYVILFLLNLYFQFRASRKARLKTISAQFHRDDWLGVIPNLSPGQPMYECLFDVAPKAHHEVSAS